MLPTTKDLHHTITHSISESSELMVTTFSISAASNDTADRFYFGRFCLKIFPQRCFRRGGGTHVYRQSTTPVWLVVSEASKKLSWNELLHLKELQRSKVPHFMKELYAAMVDSGGTAQKQNKLDGNVVDLYEMLDGRVKPWRGNLITSRLLPMNTTGWEVFNITDTATKWILNSSTNNGILVVSTLPSGQWFETTVSTGGLTKSEENDAYLVIYSDDGRRGSGQKSGSPLDLVLESKLSLQTAGRRRRSTARSSPDHEQFVTCQKAPLYVDFARIGWSGWIISPKGYNAYHCVGSCPFPLGGSLRATNHAIVQSIVDALKLSNKVEQPCCVPDILHPISLLYFDDEENVVLKQYDDMVAGSCGCH
ncbi:hypothetical protein AOLI_G00141040 [Acnodon oligacanthus]